MSRLRQERPFNKASDVVEKVILPFCTKENASSQAMKTYLQMLQVQTKDIECINIPDEYVQMKRGRDLTDSYESDSSSWSKKSKTDSVPTYDAMSKFYTEHYGVSVNKQVMFIPVLECESISPLAMEMLSDFTTAANSAFANAVGNISRMPPVKSLVLGSEPKSEYLNIFVYIYIYLYKFMFVNMNMNFYTFEFLTITLSVHVCVREHERNTLFHLD